MDIIVGFESPASAWPRGSNQGICPQPSFATPTGDPGYCGGTAAKPLYCISGTSTCKCAYPQPRCFGLASKARPENPHPRCLRLALHLESHPPAPNMTAYNLYACVTDGGLVLGPRPRASCSAAVPESAGVLEKPLKTLYGLVTVIKRLYPSEIGHGNVCANASGRQNLYCLGLQSLVKAPWIPYFSLYPPDWQQCASLSRSVLLPAVNARSCNQVFDFEDFEIGSTYSG